MAKTTSGLDLKVLRIRADATQKELSRYLGVSAARVSAIERTGNTPNTGIDPETEQRYRDAVAAFTSEKEGGKNPVERVELTRVAFGTTQEQYRAAKQQARQDARRWRWAKRFEVIIEPETPGATLLGYLDGLQALGVSYAVLDGRGTVVNRRIG